MVTDETGAAVAGAVVTWSRDGLPSKPPTKTTADGQFSLAAVPAGRYVLTVSSPGFASQTVSTDLAAGETRQLPPIRLRLAFDSISVDVIPVVEVAERQIKAQEQQRLLGVLPNFFVVYEADAAPLTPGQKFELFRKSILDPADFAFTGIVAGVQHARNDFAGFGRGFAGYSKRYGALYASIFTRSAIDGVILPIVLRQDPRYFYKGTGSTASRFGYAVATAFVRKGDDRRWQPNYSTIGGGLAAGALTNFFYPAQDRRGMRLTLENSAIALATTAASHLAQEFLFPKLTTRAAPQPPVKEHPEDTGGPAASGR